MNETACEDVLLAAIRRPPAQPVAGRQVYDPPEPCRQRLVARMPDHVSV